MVDPRLGLMGGGMGGMNMASKEPTVVRRSKGVVDPFGGSSMLAAPLKMLGNFSNLLMFAPMLGGVLKWAGGKAPASISPHLMKAAGAAKLPDVSADKFHHAFGEVFGHSSKATHHVGKASTSIAAFAQKTLGNDLHGRLEQKSVGNLVTSASFAAIGTANLALDSSRKIRILKAMYSDFTGGKSISTWSLMTGKNLPPLIKAARREAFGGMALVSTAAELTQIGSSLYFLGAKKEPSMVKQMGLGIGLSMVPTLMRSSHTALQSYEMMRMTAEGNIPHDAYAGLIGGLAPRNASSEAVEELAKRAAEHGASSTDVLRVVNEAFYSEKRAVGAATARIAAQRSEKAMGPATAALAS